MAFLGDMVLFAVFALSFGLVASVVLFFTYRQARKKGYRPPAASLVLVAGGALGVAGTVARAPGNTTNFALFLWSFFWVPLLLSAAAMGIILLVLPQRPARVFGERRVSFPFRRVGQALIVLAVLLVPFIGVMILRGLAQPSTLGSSVSLAIMLTVAGLYLIRRGRRVHMPALEDVLRDDPRPPVLYLRAFNQESQFFIIGTKAEYGRWGKSFHAVLSREDQKIGITVEEYLADEITTRIGPFVALGSPEDYLAPPGALRVYAKDDDWKQRFDELARKAACVIVEVSKSDNLRWEFEHLRGAGLQEKLFVLTRPSTEGSKVGWAFWGLLWRLKGIRTMSWQEFSTDLAQLGYEIGFGNPGTGVVLGFDAESKGFVLTTEANWPQEFVEPTGAWIADRQKVGKCVPARCTKCGRAFYAAPSASAALCFDCRLGSTPAKRAWKRLGWAMFGILILLLPVGLSVLLALVFPSFVDSRWFGWIFTAIFLLVVGGGVYLAGRD